MGNSASISETSIYRYPIHTKKRVKIKARTDLNMCLQPHRDMIAMRRVLAEVEAHEAGFNTTESVLDKSVNA